MAIPPTARPNHMKSVTDPTADALTPMALQAYTATKDDFIEWMETDGNDGDGYAADTIRVSSSCVDAYFRWRWDHYPGTDWTPTIETADAFMDMVADEDWSDSHKNNIKLAIAQLFEYQGIDWECDHDFSAAYDDIPDHFTDQERSKLLKAAINHADIPSYTGLDHDERERYRIHLAQRLEKPKDEVTATDFDDARSWKIPSLVYVSDDLGLRPIEVERMKTHWVDTDEGRIRIPKKGSSKGNAYWDCILSTRANGILSHWIDERACRSKYDGRDEVWLTEKANPYNAGSLRKLMIRLAGRAGINLDTHQRSSWYLIRHTTGTRVAREAGIENAKRVLRHKHIETTQKYVHGDEQQIEDALNSMAV